MTSLSTYKVVVSNLTRGWSLTATSESLMAAPDPNDTTVRRLLAGPFKARWGFREGLIPNPMDPERVTVHMWTRTVAEEYAVDLGDIVAVDVYLDDVSGLRLFTLSGGRVTEADSDLVPTDPWAVRTKIEVTGLAIEPQGKFTGPHIGFNWRKWVQACDGRSGVPIGFPSWVPTTTTPAISGQPTADAVPTTIDRLSRSYAPTGNTLTTCAYYDPAKGALPTGYMQSTWTGGDSVTETPLASSPIRILLAPAGRREFTAFAPALQFAVLAGMVTVTSTPGSVSPRRQPALSAAWCRIPTNVRRTRDHVVNNAIVNGVKKSSTSSVEQASTATATDVVDAAARGVITRETDTMAIVRLYDITTGADGGTDADALALATNLLSDSSVLASTRAYESLEVLPHLMPPTEAANVLPYLTRHIPGQPGGDGRLLRHVTVYGVDESLASADLVPGGFITSGELTIEGGVMRYRLTTTPGQPIYTAGSPTPITVGDFIVKTFATSALYPNAKVDPTIRVADLDLIGA